MAFSVMGTRNFTYSSIKYKHNYRGAVPTAVQKLQSAGGICHPSSDTRSNPALRRCLRFRTKPLRFAVSPRCAITQCSYHAVGRPVLELRRCCTCGKVTSQWSGIRRTHQLPSRPMTISASVSPSPSLTSPISRNRTDPRWR